MPPTGSPTPNRPSPTPLPRREQMQADLTRAMKGRDQRAVNVLRTTLAAIANAEAPPAPAAAMVPVVGQLVEHPRLTLTEADVEEVLQREIADREDTIDRYRSGGRLSDADPLLEELAILRTYLR